MAESKVIVAAGADILRRLFRGCGDDLALILRGAFQIIQGVVKVALGIVLNTLGVLLGHHARLA